MSIGNIAETGMNAAMSDMEVISNNIANANTYGFKRSYTSFADLYPYGYGASGAIPGMGVQVASINQNFSKTQNFICKSIFCYFYSGFCSI